MHRISILFLHVLIFTLTADFLFSQTVNTDTLSKFTTTVAGKEYEASGFKRWLWGNNYRDEWIKPVTVKMLWLDTAGRNFKIISPRISNQGLNLDVRNAEGKEYLIRPVNKTLGKNLPALFRGTFVAYRLEDAGSTSNPYAAAPVVMLADKANIHQTNIAYLYVPAQPALGIYNHAYANNLYVFEEVVPRNFENYITTAQLFDSLNNNINNSIDEQAFIKARLFDMFINDWNRREDNWLWSKTNNGNKTVYIPLPVNRDQAFSDHDGLLLSPALNAAGFKFVQKFNNNMPDVKYFNYTAKDLDRRLLNQAILNEWITAAKALQQFLTDKIIGDAVKQFPPEIYAQTGKETITKLKARRGHLVEWATDYYKFISKEVEIPGTYHAEAFKIERMNKRETRVQVFDAANKNTPVYSRTFHSFETKEIRLFGLKGDDTYSISGNASNNIKIKIIDGLKSDSVIDVSSSNKTNNKILVYAADSLKTNEQNSIRIINDTLFRSYRYDWFNYNRKGFVPKIFYNNEDRLFVALGYNIRHYKWGRVPFASNQLFDLHYSLLEGAFSFTYNAMFPNAALHSNLLLHANYDDIRWQFYFGLGNDTKADKGLKAKYYTTRTRQWIFQPQLTKVIGKSTVSVFANVQGIKVINDSTRFIGKPSANTTDFNWQTYAGGGINYSFQKLDSPLIPIKGFYLTAAASGQQNLYNRSSHYMSYSGAGYLYVPLVSKFSLNIRAGASTVTGNPEFYQYASIGGTIFRGTARDRFRGKTAFYNTNDLRFISPVHSYLVNGKAGLLAFVDDGRVWLPAENSNTWHVAYGGGIIVAPFNFIYADATYGRYKKENSIQVRINYVVRY